MEIILPPGGIPFFKYSYRREKSKKCSALDGPEKHGIFKEPGKEKFISLRTLNQKLFESVKPMGSPDESGDGNELSRSCPVLDHVIGFQICTDLH